MLCSNCCMKTQFLLSTSKLVLDECFVTMPHPRPPSPQGRKRGVVKSKFSFRNGYYQPKNPRANIASLYLIGEPSRPPSLSSKIESDLYPYVIKIVFLKNGPQVTAPALAPYKTRSQSRLGPAFIYNHQSFHLLKYFLKHFERENLTRKYFF